jgi:hypothetical protein
MPVKLNRKAYTHARAFVKNGRVARDERDAWSEDQPSTREENKFIESYGIAEYGKWHLGIDPNQSPDTKAHYKFPYGDFKRVHRCAVITAESRAGQYKYFDVEKAAHRLHNLIDKRPF